MAVMGLAWWAGLAIAPTVGTALLSHAPAAVFVAAAATAAAAGVSALMLERALPEASRRTPAPGGATSS
jgi:hypothetical protein